jgi:hypothetical protein
MTNGKPFNPILGETFQAKIGDTTYYVEQTSHHPPITHYLFVGPEGRSYGWIGVEAGISGNQMNMNFLGKHIIESSDGGKYQITFPDMFMSGVMIGQRYINYIGAMKIEDLTNNMIAYVRFNPDDRGFFSKMFSKDTYPDYVT